MKGTSPHLLLLVVSTLIIITYAQNVTTVTVSPSTFNGKCASCVVANNYTYFYCTKTNECSDVEDPSRNCDRNISVCLDYKATDLGMKEIAPFNTTTQTFN